MINTCMNYVNTFKIFLTAIIMDCLRKLRSYIFLSTHKSDKLLHSFKNEKRQVALIKGNTKSFLNNNDQINFIELKR